MPRPPCSPQFCICGLLLLLHLWQAQVCHIECTRTYCALSAFPSGRASFDFTGGTCSDRSQMIQDDSKPSWLIPPERLTELWEHSSSSHSRPSAALEPPIQRTGQGPVQEQGPAWPAVPPRGLIWRCQANPSMAQCQPHCCDRSWK